jgi:hypothetical protein
VLLRRFDDKEFEVASHLIRIGDQIEVDRNGLLDSRVVKPLGDACTIGCISGFLADLGQVLLRIGLLDMGQELGAFAHQVCAASKQITGRAHLGRIDIGFWKHAAAEQGGNLLRVDFVVFGFTAVDGFHVEGMPQHKGNTLWRTEVGQPVPGEDTFDGHHQPVTIGRNGLEKRFRSGFHVAVHQDFPAMVHDTNIHAPGMQVDTAVKLVLLGVEAHEVSSS